MYPRGAGHFSGINTEEGDLTRLSAASFSCIEKDEVSVVSMSDCRDPSRVFVAKAFVQVGFVVRGAHMRSPVS